MITTIENGNKYLASNAKLIIKGKKMTYEGCQVNVASLNKQKDGTYLLGNWTVTSKARCFADTW